MAQSQIIVRGNSILCKKHTPPIPWLQNFVPLLPDILSVSPWHISDLLCFLHLHFEEKREEHQHTPLVRVSSMTNSGLYASHENMVRDIKGAFQTWISSAEAPLWDQTKPHPKNSYKGNLKSFASESMWTHAACLPLIAMVPELPARMHAGRGHQGSS